MPTATLDLNDAIELAEMLEFISNWLAFDYDNLDASLRRFINPSHPHSDAADQLRHDLDRFVLLLGLDHGERLFNPNPD